MIDTIVTTHRERLAGVIFASWKRMLSLEYFAVGGESL